MAGYRRKASGCDYSASTSQSALETVGRHALIEAGIPGFRSIRGQVPFEYQDLAAVPLSGRMDLLINGFVCVELDGRSKYTSDFISAEERMREKFILNAGYLLIRATWKDVWRGTLVTNVANALQRVRSLADDPFAGNVPRPLRSGELEQRRYRGH
ncbi:hypothetical protein CAPI_03630 [Corynebacterium capitovis DSM 44611]|uniref:hypothetical protein n=1 Tax=Corynebacterium capitovis TaxID=131081 RepID=UPI000372F166|nr:hypothetical protein [Corynebacterium capitovis]WKD57286.1 hypothetical protein CAPI_03630 [Corynebacterium capitovis DSM 44611]